MHALLAVGGTVYFTQTFEHRRSRAVELVKPLLRRLIGIDFGRVTYEPEFRKTLDQAGFRLIAIERLGGGLRRSAVLATAHP